MGGLTAAGGAENPTGSVGGAAGADRSTPLTVSFENTGTVKVELFWGTKHCEPQAARRCLRFLEVCADRLLVVTGGLIEPGTKFPSVTSYHGHRWVYKPVRPLAHLTI